MSTKQQAPVWARPEAFPAKPTSGAFGFQDTKGKRHTADSLKSLIQKIAKSKQGVDLVWSPESDHCVVPEELVSLRKTLAERRIDWAQNDLSDGRKLTLLMGTAFLWASYAAYINTGGDWRAVVHSPTVAIIAIMLLIFGMIPYYEGWKELQKSGKYDTAYWAKEVAYARFDSWLNQGMAPYSFLLLFIMIFTGAAQWYVAGSAEWASATVQKVGLLKQLNPAGDPWWRYLTAPLVHGNLVHWLMNFAALRYLARLAEVLVRWPHMILVFLISAFVGGMTTAYFVPSVSSVGASGGILGLLGFLLVFETLHRTLVPRAASKRLVAGLVVVALMGAIGFSFIDNAAHAGGLVAGMLYALIVFPPTTSVFRPEILLKDKVLGYTAVVVLVIATGVTIILLLS